MDYKGSSSGKNFSEEDFLQLAGIQHFTFCRRQWALIHIEQQWEENLRTVEGNLFHKKAHDGENSEKRGDLIISRGMPVFSRELRVNGVCDVVEFHREDTDGVSIFGREGKYKVFPVEYKRGEPKESDADVLQMAAQAMCLEEMLCCDISKGYLYYGETRRRLEIRIDIALRERVKNMFAEMHNYYDRRYTPKVKWSKACNACSLKEVCLPKLLKNKSVKTYLADKMGENVVVLEGKIQIGRVPLHNLESIVTFGRTGASPALMGACAKRNISLCFLSEYGKFLARVTGEIRGNVVLRKTQYAFSEDEEKSAMLARNFIIGKIYNSKWILERATRDYAMRLDVEKLKRASSFLQNSMLNLKECNILDSIRGIEGEAASVYFSVFDDLILQQKETFSFQTRNRRPPLDKVNALLSFTYTLLTNMCASALEAVGLDPYVGYLHRDRPGRVSLALDLMEELRSVLADRFVITLINKRIIDPTGFTTKENGAVVMDDDTRKTVLTAWQNRKQEIITHPFLGEKIEWGMVPFVQAMLLARFLRGDLDEYPSFMWK